MKQKVLILHQTLSCVDKLLADARLCMMEPHIVYTLDEALARLQRNQYTMIVVEVISNPQCAKKTGPVYRYAVHRKRVG